MSVLISILILILVLLVIFWVVDMLPLPANISLIIKAIIGLIVLIKVLMMAGIGL